MNKFALIICALFFYVGHVLAEPVPWPVKPAKTFFKQSGNIVQITTPEEFALMVKYATDSTKSNYYFTLMTDIVINEGDASTWGKNPPKYKWTSVGDTTRPAKLSLNGNGHTISGLYVNSEDDFQGLFGYLDGGVYNLNIVNSFIKGRNFVGSAAGAMASSVHKIFVDAIVEGNNYVGGVVGYPGYASDAVSVNQCIFKGSVKGRGHVGGIFGYGSIFYGDGGGVSECDNYGSVYGGQTVGGIVGGFSVDVPESSVYFTKLRNYGTVSGNKYVGGLAGSFGIGRDGDINAKYNISLLRNMGEIIGESYVGGLIGNYGGGQAHYLFDLEESYNAGRVSGEGYPTASLYNFSPYSSDRKDTIIRCFNFAETYYQGTLLEEKTKMSEIDKYADSLGPNYLPDTGDVKINGGYPILLSESRDFKYLKGSGTKNDPFLISSFDDLLLFNKHSGAIRYKDKEYYKQTADIEWNAQENWKPIPVQEIHYDGGGHKISKLRSYSENGCAAFLDATDQPAYVDNLVLEDVDIRGGTMAAGVLCSGPLYASNIKVSGSIAAMDRVGNAGGVIAFMWYGSIINVVNEADVSAELSTGMAGGIMGRTRYAGDKPIICNVVNRGTIRTTLNAGGITGKGGVIMNAENYGSVFADGHVGGISGLATVISNSFNRGEVVGEGVVGGVAGSVELAYGVYNAGRIVTDYPEVVGAVFAEIERYYGKLDSGRTAIQYAYHQKDGFPFAGKIASGAGIMDTASFTHEEFIDKDVVKDMNRTFAADEKNVNDGYPVISYEFDGEGTAEKPFLIKGKEDLVMLSRLSLDSNRYAFYTDKNYRLTQDIVFDSSETWTPISGWRRDSFKGVFDGDGHVISNLLVNLDPSGSITESKAAFIANASGATIKNLGIKNANIRGRYAAAIVADAADVKIVNCWNDHSNIYGGSRGGGIVGSAESSILLDRCFNTGTIDGEYDIGGLIGELSLKERSYVLNSYHRGKLAKKSSSGKYAFYGFVRLSPLLVQQNLYTTDSLASNVCAECTNDNIYHLKRNEKDSTGLSEKEMKSRDFAERLGEAFAYDSLGVNDGFPILSGKEVPLPVIPEDTATAVKPEVQKSGKLNFTVAVLNRNIVLQGEMLGKKVAVFDVRGAKVWSGAAQANALSIPMAKPGIYIVRCGRRTSKIVVR